MSFHLGIERAEAKYNTLQNQKDRTKARGDPPECEWYSYIFDTPIHTLGVISAVGAPECEWAAINHTEGG